MGPRQETCPAAFKEILDQCLLGMLGINTPSGVFVARGKRGRPRKEETTTIMTRWREMGEPSRPIPEPVLRKIAQSVYPDDFEKAKSEGRRLIKERVRATIVRYVAMSPQ